MNSSGPQKSEWAQFFVVFAIGMIVCILMIWVGSTHEYVPPIRKVWEFPAPPQLSFAQILGVLGRLGTGLLFAALVVRCFACKEPNRNENVGQTPKL